MDPWAHVYFRIGTIMTITRTSKKANRPPWWAMGLLDLLMGANIFLIYQTLLIEACLNRIKNQFSYQFPISDHFKFNVQ